MADQDRDQDRELTGAEALQMVRQRLGAKARDLLAASRKAVDDVQKAEGEASGKPKFSKGDRVRLKASYLRGTGQYTGREANGKWTVVPHDCEHCKSGRRVAVDQDNLDHDGPRHFAAENLEHFGKSVRKSEDLKKVTPPDVSEETAHKIKKEYPGEKSKAYATMWSIHNKLKKSADMHKAELEKTGACPECHAPVGVDEHGRVNKHPMRHAVGKAEDCAGGGKQLKIDLKPTEKAEPSLAKTAIPALGRALRLNAADKRAVASKPAPVAAPAPAQPMAKTAIPALGRTLRLNAADKRAALPAAPKPAPVPPASAPPVAKDEGLGNSDVAMAEPPPVPAAARKPPRSTSPASSPEGLPLVGHAIPPRIPGIAVAAGRGAVGKRLPPAKLPGMVPGTQKAERPKLPGLTPPPVPAAKPTSPAKADREMGSFKSVASSPTAMPHNGALKGKMPFVKSEKGLCKNCGKAEPMHKNAYCE